MQFQNTNDSKRRSSNTLSLLHDMRTLIWRDDIILEEVGMLQVIGEYRYVLDRIIDNIFLVVSPRECESGAAFSQDRGT